MVGEVVGRGLRVDPEGGRYQFRISAGGKLGQAGAAEQAGLDVGGTQNIADVVL